MRTTTSPKQTETIVMHEGINETRSVKGCIDMCSIKGREGKKVTSPKEPPSWVKHKIYNMWSKVVAHKEIVSTRGLASDKIPKVTLGRISHIAIAKSQVEVEVKSGKQETIGRALRARQAQDRVSLCWSYHLMHGGWGAPQN